MKKILSSTILLALLSATTAWGQASDKQMNYGAKIGMANSAFTNYHEVNGLKRMGISVGAFAEYKVHEMVAVEVDLSYVQEGANDVSPSLIYSNLNSSYPSNSDYYVNNCDIRLNTLQLPVLINIRPSMNKNVQPKITLGYSFDYIMSAIAQNEVVAYNTNGGSTDYNYTIIDERSKENVTSSFKSFNMGPVVGLGIDFPGDYNYYFDVRYKVGLSDINNLGGINTYNVVRDFSSNTLTVTVGIGF